MQRLVQTLARIDGKGYKAYKDIQGMYHFAQMDLHVDHVQGDPYASPSRIRVVIKPQLTTLKAKWFDKKHRKIACEDFLARRIACEIDRFQPTQRTFAPIHNVILIDRPRQEILQRTTVLIRSDSVEVRLSIELPAQGRRILGQQAKHLLTDWIPTIIKRAFKGINEQELEEHLELVDDQMQIRHFLKEKGYIAFVANGSILPRQSGVSNKPLTAERAVPFESPPSLELCIPLTNNKTIRGMGIPRGITLIVGGGYHGKSTLLQALERGVYHHIKGDGREFVVTDDTACKIRSEDGRRIENVNVSPFITHLPFQKDTVRFSTENASGSTSQAANIMEALEMGTELLLIDEDTSATNFMIRDARMQQLVAKEQEPITPFVDKVQQLYHELNVSTILVLGGSGDYFDVADRVLKMYEYRPYDVTTEAKKIAAAFSSQRKQETTTTFGKVVERVPLTSRLSAQRGKKEKIDAKGLHTLLFGSQQIDLTLVEQLIDPSQTRAIANMLRLLKHSEEGQTIRERLDSLYRQIDKNGLDELSPFKGKHPGDFALPRKFEVAAALNRLRVLRFTQTPD